MEHWASVRAEPTGKKERKKKSERELGWTVGRRRGMEEGDGPRERKKGRKMDPAAGPILLLVFSINCLL